MTATSARIRSRPRRGTEARVYIHALVARFYFYMPVLVHHMQTELTAAGVERPEIVAVSIIGLLSVGMLIAQYPSGLLADWLGCARSLAVAGVLQIVGTLLFLIPGSLWAIAGAQILIGVATAFRSGADTALLHAHLERVDQAQRYGTALARLRFLNTLAIGLAGLAGGFLYAWRPASVFIGAAVASLLGLGCLIGLDEAPAPVQRSYRQVLWDSVAGMRASRAVQALILLGAIGNPFFVFIFWVTQRYLIDAKFSLGGIGVTVASISLLQAATMPASAWISRAQRRLTVGLFSVVVALPLAFLAVAQAWKHAPSLGAMLLVAVAGCHVLFRNIVNVQLQGLVPRAIRASVVSFEAWLGALGYLVLFPFGGFLLANGGLSGAFVWLAVILAICLWPLSLMSRAQVMGSRES